MSSKFGLKSRKILAALGLLRRNESGVAAVEFALIAPVLIIAFMGVIEISHAVTVDRRVSMVAHSMADLVAKQENVCTADIADLKTIGAQLLAPYAGDPLTINVFAVRAAAGNTGASTVEWSSAGGPAAGSSYTIPPDLIADGRTGIVSEATYAYSPPFTQHFMSPFSMTERSILAPRGGCVAWCGGTC